MAHASDLSWGGMCTCASSRQVCCVKSLAERALRTGESAQAAAAAAQAAAEAAQADADLALLRGLLTVGNLDELSAVDTTGFAEGKLAYVVSVRDYFSWSPSSLLKAGS